YDYAWDFSEGMACVKLNGRYGFFNKTGKEIPIKYDGAGNFYEGLAAVKLNDKWGYIDKTDKVVIPFKYDDVVIPFKYYDIGNFCEGLAGVKLNDKWGYIDKTDKVVIPFKYDDIGNFCEGLAAVKLNGKWGYIDRTGNVVIPLKYDYAWDFSEGLSTAKLNGKWGYIDKTDKVVIPFKYDYAYGFQKGRASVRLLNGEWEAIENPLLKNKFSVFARKYVENKINEWQKKDEFEKTIDWQNRVNEITRKEKVATLTKEAEQLYINQKSEIIDIKQNIKLNEYDADNEVYLVESEHFGNLLVPVPINKAPNFKANWNSVTFINPKYFIENDVLTLAELTFTLPDNQSFKYSNQASLNYTTAKVDYNFEPITIDVADNSGSKGQQNISTVNLNVGKSDVDMNVPEIKAKNDKTFAIIISNEKYQLESQVEFANNDGFIFKKYCIKTLGLPEKNVHYKTDATLNNIHRAINWISDVAQAYNGEANIIFYYAGHGIPDENSKTAYLLPIDGYGSDVTSGYKLDDLYQKLGSLPAKTVTVFMDACFSGAQRSGAMLASARGVAIKTAQGTPSGNMVVFSAAQGDETAYPYKEKGHGLFTYFLLKKLQESKGEVTLGELSSYITTNVRQQSIVVNSKSQTPTVIPSATLDETWTNLKLK
ncbi:MAG: WG repeat-containing protein, partial [Prevotellaceae bacterium]|nr:WG repeat-containing protein [Prevotellaceae bacterium]